ncbi:hypothetical protein ACVIDN_007609 [Rhizobium brockwellii]
MKWQLSNGYGKRSLIERQSGDKSPSSGGDSGQSRPGRETEGVSAAVLNRMLDYARPKSLRRKAPRHDQPFQ